LRCDTCANLWRADRRRDVGKIVDYLTVNYRAALGARPANDRQTGKKRGLGANRGILRKFPDIV
jgi:hypothetical protein